MGARVLLRLLVPAALAFGAPALAETPVDDLVGTYDGGQTEIGAGLQLGADGRFQYFLSYGAIDEMASGSWAPADDGIVLDSDPVTAPAFELFDSKSGSSSAFDLALDLPERIPAQFFEAELWFSDGSAVREEFDEPNLHLKLPKGKSVTGVVLLFPIYLIASEQFTVPANTASMHFRFAPNDLGSVDFDHQVLLRDGDAFLLSRYDRTLQFRKEAPPPDPLEQVLGTWTFGYEDCEPDSDLPSRVDMPGTVFTLAPDHTYRLIHSGAETTGTFTLNADDPDYVILTLEQAQLSFIVNFDQLDSWSDEPVATQCTQVFERQPGG